MPSTPEGKQPSHQLLDLLRLRVGNRVLFDDAVDAITVRSRPQIAIQLSVLHRMHCSTGFNSPWSRHVAD
jgi:hypothetical protein